MYHQIKTFESVSFARPNQHQHQLDADHHPDQDHSLVVNVSVDSCKRRGDVVGAMSTTKAMLSPATIRIKEFQKHSESEQRAHRVATIILQNNFETMQMASTVSFGQVSRVHGLTRVENTNLIALVHDDCKISLLGVLNQDWQLQIVATFQVFEMDRRQKAHSSMLNGQIAGIDGRLFVINRSSTRIFKLDYQLFEAATSLDAFESADLIGEEISRSVFGCFQGLAVIEPYKELYTSTGDHVIVFSTETGRELIRSALVQPPSKVLSSWSNCGICYGIPNDPTSAVRIKFFRQHSKHSGYDVKIINSNALVSDQGTHFDRNTNCLLNICRDKLQAFASMDSLGVSSSSCCVFLPQVTLIESLSEIGITQPIGLTTLEPKVHGSGNNSSIVVNSRPLTIILDKESTCLFVFA